MAVYVFILNRTTVRGLLYSTFLGKYFLKETDDKECVGRLDKPEHQVGCESLEYKGIKGRERKA